MQEFKMSENLFEAKGSKKELKQQPSQTAQNFLIFNSNC